MSCACVETESPLSTVVRLANTMAVNAWFCEILMLWTKVRLGNDIDASAVFCVKRTWPPINASKGAVTTVNTGLSSSKKLPPTYVTRGNEAYNADDDCNSSSARDTELTGSTTTVALMPLRRILPITFANMTPCVTLVMLPAKAMAY